MPPLVSFASFGGCSLALAYTMASFALFIGVDRLAAASVPSMQNLTDIGVGLPVGTNIVVTKLTAGRIRYLPRPIDRYPISIVIFIESDTAVVIIQLILSMLIVNSGSQTFPNPLSFAAMVQPSPHTTTTGPLKTTTTQQKGGIRR